jgi:hypothetical protein
MGLRPQDGVAIRRISHDDFIKAAIRAAPLHSRFERSLWTQAMPGGINARRRYPCVRRHKAGPFDP